LGNEFPGWDWVSLNINVVKEGDPLLPRAEGTATHSDILGKEKKKGKPKVEGKALEH
jgi:hypothetical protein